MPPVGAPEVAQLVSAIRFYCEEDSQNRALLKALRSRGVPVSVLTIYTFFSTKARINRTRDYQLFLSVSQ